MVAGIRDKLGTDDLLSPCDHLVRRGSNQSRSLSEVDSSQAQGKAVIMRGSRRENSESDNCREEDRDTAHWAVMVRGDEGDERADD